MHMHVHGTLNNNVMISSLQVSTAMIVRSRPLIFLWFLKIYFFILNEKHSIVLQ